MNSFDDEKCASGSESDDHRQGTLRIGGALKRRTLDDMSEPQLREQLKLRDLDMGQFTSRSQTNYIIFAWLSVQTRIEVLLVVTRADRRIFVRAT